MATRLSLEEMLLQGNFLQRKIRIQTEVASERMNAKCGEWLEALGHQSRRGVGSKSPCSPESALSGPRGWTQFSTRDVYRLTHLLYK